MTCKFCKNSCAKKGFNKNKQQKYFCGNCNKHQLTNYKNKACQTDCNKMLIKLLCNGCGIRDIARILKYQPLHLLHE